MTLYYDTKTNRLVEKKEKNAEDGRYYEYRPSLEDTYLEKWCGYHNGQLCYLDFAYSSDDIQDPAQVTAMREASFKENEFSASYLAEYAVPWVNYKHAALMNGVKVW